MSENIRLYIEDWLYTSGVVGIYNILKYSKDEVIVKDNYVEFNKNCLVGFEDKYFNYFIDKYKDVISINKIISFEEFLIKHRESNFENFDENSLEFLDKSIREVFKKYLKSNSYKAAYDLIEIDVNILDLEKELKGLKLKKKENIEDIISEVKNQFDILEKIIDYFKSDSAIKYIGAKNAMYTVIKNGWNGVCFLNPQTKEKDMYLDYRNYFINPVAEYIDDNKEKYKYSCFACDGAMKNLSNDLSFVNATGFDVNKKSSHVWDFQNDVAICPICKLVYSCVPAGINYVYDKGIYVNENTRMEKAININEKIYFELYKNNENNKRLTYKALVESINKEFNNKLKYELSDVQVVRYENEKYKFNMLSKNTLALIKKSESELSFLSNKGFKEINTYFNIYELVVERLLNGQNMFTLIQKLMYYKISQPKDSFYRANDIIKILKINKRFLEEVGAMEYKEKDIIKFGNAAGYYLREKYRAKGSVDKLSGISYKLLNALKTNNKNAFMDTVLNCYLYTKGQVPNIFLDVLKSDEEFKTIGYAFVAGLIEGENKEGTDNK